MLATNPAALGNRGAGRSGRSLKSTRARFVLPAMTLRIRRKLHAALPDSLSLQRRARTVGIVASTRTEDAVAAQRTSVFIAVRLFVESPKRFHNVVKAN